MLPAVCGAGHIGRVLLDHQRPRSEQIRRVISVANVPVDGEEK